VSNSLKRSKCAVLGLLLLSGSVVHGFTVTTTGDYSDSSPGDGSCTNAGPIAGNVEAPTVVSCSLRAAIEEANALGGIASIDFSPSLDGNPITLGSQLPAVTTQLAITGNGAPATIVEASTCDPIALPNACKPATWRVFQIGAAGNLALADLTVRHGNVTAGDGGGILNSGTLRLSGVTISANSAVDSGGGIENASTGTIDAIVASTFSGNQSGNNGGGVDNFSGGTITQITSSHFSANQAWYGAGLYAGIAGQVSNSTFVGNTALYYGGGIYADRNLSLVTRCTFDGNSSGEQGGGFYTDSTNAVGQIAASLFTGNSSKYGGGLREFDGSMGTIVNSTFSGNTATVEGGAIETKSGVITGIFNVTITGNTAPLGAGIYTESNIPISNSIFGDNSGAGANCEGTFTDSGGNFSDDASCDSAGTIVPGTDYSLTLANNGGPTKTHALLHGSPAIDTTGACPAELHGVDQRGAPRDDHCDSGAFEYNFIFADGFEGSK
jgi:CSLREA domain-containing protein